MAERTKSVKEVFVPNRPKYVLSGTEYEIKLSSSFNFNEMTEFGAIQDMMESVLDEARENGDIDEEGNPNINRVKYALPLADANLQRLQMHLQKQITLEEMKEIDGEEIRLFQIFLTEQDEARMAEMENQERKQESMREQRKVLQQKTNSGKTS